MHLSGKKRWKFQKKSWRLWTILKSVCKNGFKQSTCFEAFNVPSHDISIHEWPTDVNRLLSRESGRGHTATAFEQVFFLKYRRKSVSICEASGAKLISEAALNQWWKNTSGICPKNVCFEEFKCR